MQEKSKKKKSPPAARTHIKDKKGIRTFLQKMYLPRKLKGEK